ncbi:glycosyltransferase family 4 protein [Patescibacteria group bacterium]|nr:glycosyltransferase family 4 protein [Patescibacteria group bacterium]
MNILYITQTLPLPLDNGGNIKSYSTISLLKKLGHNVTIFSFVDDEYKIKYEKMLKEKDFIIGKTKKNSFITIKRNGFVKIIIHYLLNFLSIKPYSVSKFYCKDFASSIEDYVKTHQIDCVWIGYLSMSQYLPEETGYLKILEQHNVDSIFYWRMFQNDSFLRWKIFAFFEWIKYLLYEKNQLKKFDKITVMSDVDKYFIKNITHRNNIIVTPPTIKYKIPFNKNREKKTLLFVGSLRWYPNKDGIYWYLKSIHPKLIKLIPDIHINIIGKLPRRNIFPIYPGVKFWGYQRNLERFWKKSTVFIVPIRYGSGLRLKILEAMSWGIPIISTDEGAKGLEVKNGREILLVQSGKDFTDKIELLLNKKNLQKKLVENAYIFLSKNHSLNKLQKIFTT